jgi:hypothetical protein
MSLQYSEPDIDLRCRGPIAIRADNRIVLLAIAAVCLTGPLLAGCETRSTTISTAREWTDTAELPPASEIVHTEKTGTMFSRQVLVCFEAPRSVIDRWLQKSPGIAEVGRGRWEYEVDHTDAVHARVLIDWDDATVTLTAYWS